MVTFWCDGVVACKRSLKLSSPARNEKVSVTEMRSQQPISDKGTEILIPRASSEWLPAKAGQAGLPLRTEPGRRAAARQETLQNNMYYIDYKA